MDETENEVIDSTGTEEQEQDNKEFVWENLWAPDSEFTPLKEPPKKESSEYIPTNLSFLEKLQIWTDNFTTEPLDLKVLKATGIRALPELSGIEEFDEYQEIRSMFSDYSSRYNRNPAEIWEMIKKEHPDLFVSR